MKAVDPIKYEKIDTRQYQRKAPWASYRAYCLGFICIAALWLLPSCSKQSAIAFDSSETVDRLLDTISNKSISMFTQRYYLAGPHLMGENWALADHTRQVFERYGFEAEIEEFEVLRNLPGQVSVKILGNHSSSELNLEEDILQEDPTTGAPDRTPVFHGYSADGNVTGKLIYANYGRKQDFDRLAKLGYNLTGSVVLCRYGELFRGLKVKFAEEAGASGVLIYSDPRDDGKYTEENGYKPYPEGPARNPSAVQRGSVQDMGAAPGDPSTPGYPSVPGCDRSLPKSIPGIPSIPISARNGEKLLKLLDGHGKQSDEAWVGGLAADYAIGPSKVDIELVSEQDYKYVTIYNVIATLPGVYSDEIIIGNHRDAWILGGADPNSGTATMLELARVLGSLAKSGWKPQRTIKFASWDGEEYGMVGSTEWGEKHSHDLAGNTLAYLNVDVAYSGLEFGISASPLLQDSVFAAAKKVPMTGTGSAQSLYDYWLSCASGAKISAPGSGTDYVVFLDHLGIPSVDVGFEGNTESPVYHYHSNFDSYHWMTQYGDTDFSHHVAVAKFLGVLTLDLADNPVIPFRVKPYADLLSTSVSKYAQDAASAKLEASPDHELQTAVADFSEVCVEYDAHLEDLLEQLKSDPSWWKRIVLKAKIGAANRKLKYFERGFLYNKGLPGRSWYKHIVFAPGRYTGYAGQVLPGIGEAVEDSNGRQFKKWATITCDKLCALGKKLQS